MSDPYTRGLSAVGHMVRQQQILQVVTDTRRRGAQVFATQLQPLLARRVGRPVRTVALKAAGGDLPLEVLGAASRSPATLRALRLQFGDSALVVAHGSTTLTACAVAGLGRSTPWIYRNIGDPAAWGDVCAARLRIGAPLHQAAAVAALYPDARRQLISRYRLNPERVVTIPNAVESFALPNEAERVVARQALGLEPNVEWVAFVGSLTEEKGVLDAIGAVASDPDLGLVVAGDGTQRRDAAALADRVAPGRVRFLGSTDRPLQVIAAASVLVLPSRTEGMPGVAIEAGLCGVPVVATSVGGVKQIVLHDRTGLLVHSTEPQVLLHGLRQAIARRRQLGAAARAHCAEHFTLNHVADQWAELIDGVLAGTATR